MLFKLQRLVEGPDLLSLLSFLLESSLLTLLSPAAEEEDDDLLPRMLRASRTLRGAAEEELGAAFTLLEPEEGTNERLVERCGLWRLRKKGQKVSQNKKMKSSPSFLKSDIDQDGLHFNSETHFQPLGAPSSFSSLQKFHIQINSSHNFHTISF